MCLIVNLSERVIMNVSVSINSNDGSSMISYMNISVCVNFLMSQSGSKNMNMCVDMSRSVSTSVCVSLPKRVYQKFKNQKKLH